MKDPRGSLLGSLLFLIHVNDLLNKADSYLTLSADDAKVLKEV